MAHLVIHCGKRQENQGGLLAGSEQREYLKLTGQSDDVAAGMRGKDPLELDCDSRLVSGADRTSRGGRLGRLTIRDGADHMCRLQIGTAGQGLVSQCLAIGKSEGSAVRTHREGLTKFLFPLSFRPSVA